VYEHFRKTPFKGEFVVILDSEWLIKFYWFQWYKINTIKRF
jgi:hypothetical protein